MAKKIVEIEVEYPDCTICGTEISGGGVYFDLRINLSRMKVNEKGGAGGTGTGNGPRPLIICEKCSKYITAGAMIEEFGNSATFMIHKIMVELELQTRGLKKMDKRN